MQGSKGKKKKNQRKKLGISKQYVHFLLIFLLLCHIIIPVSLSWILSSRVLVSSNLSCERLDTQTYTPIYSYLNPCNLECNHFVLFILTSNWSKGLEILLSHLSQSFLLPLNFGTLNSAPPYLTGKLTIFPVPLVHCFMHIN